MNLWEMLLETFPVKRAQVSGTEKSGLMTVINASAPLAELSGYATKLRSLTQGRASYYMEPSHYEEVPRNIADAIVAKAGKIDNGARLINS